MNTDFDLENPKDEEPLPVKKKTSPARKVTLCAVCVAIASVLIVVTIYVPFFTFFPLMIAAVCFYTALKKAGIVFGFLTIIASILITAFIQPLSLTFFLTILVIAPYSFVAYLLRKYHHTKLKQALIRIGVMTVFANLVFLFCYLVIVTFAVANTDNTSFNTENIFSLHYAVLTIIFTIFFLLFDILFHQTNLQLTKRIKI